MNKWFQLESILDTMEVPPYRKAPNQVHWLFRNLFIQNGAHPKLAEAMGLIREIRRQQLKETIDAMVKEKKDE